MKPDSEVCPILVLLSQTLEVGRKEDNYPSINVPVETRQIIKKAHLAGLLEGSVNIITGTLIWHSDMSGAANGKPIEWERDYSAWSEAREYRRKTA